MGPVLAQGSAGFSLGEQSRAALEHYYQLDGSLASQYRHYLARTAHGDLGRSIVTNASVRKEIGRRLPWTLLLMGSSIALSTVLGLVAGVHSGWRRDRPVDRILLTSLLAVREFPSFLLASLLLLVFAVKVRWLPLFGARTPFVSYSPLGTVVDVGRHLVLPLAALTVGLTVGNYLIMRAGMVNELGSDYLLLGRAKGLGPRRLKYRYAARNALLPVVTIVGLQVGYLLGGAVIIENVYTLPAVGRLVVQGIEQRDYPLVQSIVFVIAALVILVNLVVDLCYAWIDPRIRYS